MHALVFGRLQPALALNFKQELLLLKEVCWLIAHLTNVLGLQVVQVDDLTFIILA